MVVCIDTNVVLPMLSLRHPFSRILDAWMDGHFSLAVSNEILTEYEEIIRPRIGAARWLDFLSLLQLGEELNGNLVRI
ncbi:putative nucleic acid-binding protein [Prosthecobacter dejongeii]|uniref:Putative nucleic acid-binding protein n=1 Tax=Prosthecobacter dejongeii TaxID=48465 RepID=A0A7W8DPM8_9BACT|nr:PIN domain-containing protein [Prosthecobacter dejongeii]MBB5037086.1 putative nucleic acid-binding protein [Prosthecobacter dejongeii]